MDKQESNENSSTKPTMGLLGEFLKQKRIDKNYTLEKLSQKTKISVNILKGLESNDYKHLPSAAYIKGFVISYVKVLGIPKDEAINKMEYTYLNVLGKPFPALNHTKTMTDSSNESPLQKMPASSAQSPHDVIESGDSIIESTKSMLPIVIFAAVILVFVGGYKLLTAVIENEVTETKVKDMGPKMESSAALVNEPEKVAAPAAPVAATPEPEATPTPKSKEPEVTPEVAKAPTVLPRNYPVVDFKKVRSKLFTVKSDSPENSDDAIFPKGIRDSMNPNLQNIYIKALDGNTWLSYKIDNSPIESVIISKGNDLFLQGSEIRVFLGNVNVTRIFYNNYLIDAPTRSGVKSLIFPEESNSKFVLPLFPKAKDDILYTSEDYIKRMKLEEEELNKKKNAQ